MKIGGKELKDIIKDGVLEIKDGLESLKVRTKGSLSKITQSSGSIVKSTFTQRVWIDGEEVDSDIAMGITSINITGNVKTVDTQGTVNVSGDVTGKISTQGRVEIQGKVDGNIDTQGRVSCGDISGNVNTMGRVDCGNVGGSIETMGKVSMRR